MKALVLSTVLFVATICNGQNIVPNANFSQYHFCPFGFSQIHYSAHWHAVTYPSTDYYDTCADYISGFDIPVNSLGIQTSSSGAYAGIFCYNENTEYREYLGTEIPPLIPEVGYRVTITVSLAEHAKYGCDGLGVFFYNYAHFDSTFGGVLSVTPQVDYSSHGVITDTANWITLSAIFIPDSAYTHIAIGGFKPDALLTKSVTNSTAVYRAAYYYIDSVAVAPLATEGVNYSATQLQAVLVPNPIATNGKLSFSNRDYSPHAFSVYNANGIVVQHHADIRESKIEIWCNDLPNGLYFYRLVNERGASASGSFSVEK